MANDKAGDAVAGHIGETLTPEQQAIRAKLAAYRKLAIKGDDAVFDSERGVFLIHGKHETLIGVESVVSVDLASLLLAVSVVLQTTVVPILTGQLSIQTEHK